MSMPAATAARKGRSSQDRVRDFWRRTAEGADVNVWADPTLYCLIQAVARSYPFDEVPSNACFASNVTHLVWKMDLSRATCARMKSEIARTLPRRRMSRCVIIQ